MYEFMLVCPFSCATENEAMAAILIFKLKKSFLTR